jgi:carboxypeptidase Q
MKYLYNLSILILGFLPSSLAQNISHHVEFTADSVVVKSIFNEALLHGESYSNLNYLCKKVGHRLTGSPQAEKAIDWGLKVVSSYDIDDAYKQKIDAPHWIRGEKEEVKLNGELLEAIALGGSIGTKTPIVAKVVEVNGVEDIDNFKEGELEGAIVFFNKPFDKSKINTFEAYGACASQRYWGAAAAAKQGAVGVLVRSLTTLTDHFPHTGSMAYDDEVKKIPAVAISTAHSDMLHNLLKAKKEAEISMDLSCYSTTDVKTYNVIGEIKGSEFPDEVIVVGAHLDSWDVGEGAHDDGAGVVQCMEVLRMFSKLDLNPKHTIRMVLYMNEESGNLGGKTYAQEAKNNKENHICAIETDRGGFSPRGFAIDGNASQIKNIASWKQLLEPYGLHYFEKGYGGVDIGPLKRKDNIVNPNLVLLGLYPDPQRYFDYHHSADDVFENVNQRELELGGASIASMVYLIDKYWDSLNIN